MKSNEYKRLARVTIAPAKTSKQGIRENINKQGKVFIGHAIAGAVSEILEFTVEMTPYLLGNQLTDAIRAKARPEFGDLLWYIAIGARDLKVKLPSSTKKIKSQTTISTEILALQTIAMELSDLQKKQFYGVGYDIEAIRAQWKKLVVAAWTVSLSVFGEAPAVIMEENITKLKTRYPDAAWDAALAQNKDHANEDAAVAASKTAAPADATASA